MSTDFQPFNQPHHRSSGARASGAIIGESASIREVIRQLEIVAETNSTVLILGETGTGKELVASAIHGRSGRRSAALVAVNCASIPSTLLESELFGHERGAFTGAHARRTGRVELAEGGSLFLDEVGEMPLQLQPRLLRLLQERTFERLGSSSTLRANVRIIAATNRDLGAMCDARAFREDLYYRLNVFPIYLPPLRDRREDIPMLTTHLVSNLAHQMNRNMPSISRATMSTLSTYDWPGNVRELQNVLERSVILSAGPELQVALPTPRSAGVVLTLGRSAAASLAELNRVHILEALQRTNGVVAGPNGAAARLGLKRSTLLFRMKKLGIQQGTSSRRYVVGEPGDEKTTLDTWSGEQLEIVA
jgi:formate hydrogenlyase transcriptional activator